MAAAAGGMALPLFGSDGTDGRFSFFAGAEAGSGAGAVAAVVMAVAAAAAVGAAAAAGSDAGFLGNVAPILTTWSPRTKSCEMCRVLSTICSTGWCSRERCRRDILASSAAGGSGPSSGMPIVEYLSVTSPSTCRTVSVKT